MTFYFVCLIFIRNNFVNDKNISRANNPIRNGAKKRSFEFEFQ